MEATPWWKEENGFLQGQDSVMPLGDTPLPVPSNTGFNHFSLSIWKSALHGQLSHSTFLNPLVPELFFLNLAHPVHKSE